MKLPNKYIASLCCIKIVKTELNNMEIGHYEVALGEVTMNSDN
jgi:hypothetical protein